MPDFPSFLRKGLIKVEKRTGFYAQLAATLILVVGCFMVLKPFLTAILFATVVCITSWPLYLWLLRKMKGMRNLAALVMTLSQVLMVILPLALVAYNLADDVTALYNEIRTTAENGPIEPPGWLRQLPLIGEPIGKYWHLVASSREEMLALAKQLLEPTKNMLLAGGILLGQGVIVMSLAALISFFIYRDGEVLLHTLRVTMHSVLGARAARILDTIDKTVRSVMYGLLGTAVAQGSVAAIGFIIASIPGAMLLGIITALLSLLPIGPPLVWGGVAIWLFHNGSTGWGIFMLLWGFFLISSVDNVVKPFLISRGSNLPFLLVLLGVMGGVLAFGFVGIFIGTALLAVAFSLIQEWSSES
ncbi:MAG TPA: AI-2E family transporter [Gallionella sp.]|nr:AI-2E family transporter [Gallionella sp.]